MADKTGAKKAPSKPLRYFYLDCLVDGKPVPMLHKKLHINRGADTITTWCYPQRKRIAYTYTDVKKRMEPAFTTKEVSKMMMRVRKQVQEAISEGKVAPPQFTYGLNEDMKKRAYMWHEDDILRLHAYFTTVHRGRPRADGKITPQKLPTARELRAMIRQREILYVKVGDRFEPVWDAEDFD